jgi:hypothetical protein
MNCFVYIRYVLKRMHYAGAITYDMILNVLLILI